MTKETGITTAGSSEKGETAQWTSSNEATLTTTLVTEKVHANWADNNPKPTAFAACVKALENGEEISGAVPKGTGVVKA